MSINPEDAIARIFAAVIYADGFMSKDEFENLETILTQYSINTPNFRQLGSITFSESIETIISDEGKEWLKSRKKTTSDLWEDMETLARCDNVITPKKAIICLCARLAIETDMCNLVS